MSRSYMRIVHRQARSWRAGAGPIAAARSKERLPVLLVLVYLPPGSGTNLPGITARRGHWLQVNATTRRAV
jgi:hypothetical protein